MTLTEFRRQVLFACLSNPAFACLNNPVFAKQHPGQSYPDALKDAVAAAEDTVEYMLDCGLNEKYEIEPDPIEV